ncbi:winged helix-turn-helix transcriptional regulator [Streptomyces sp. 4N509B]|uniref:winged helix-turn-helix transcriptional regulator n=1 Tax=Streptomyces sp. 4N509B TaxID=3457413 RepID=UPI003FD08AFC
MSERTKASESVNEDTELTALEQAAARALQSSRSPRPAEPAEPAQLPGDHPGVCTEPDSALMRVFGLLGKRWTGVVIASLISGPGHFAELRRAIPGVSERMLSDRLRELAELDLVTRHVEHGPPLRVTYELTDAGHGLAPALSELACWARRHLPAEERERCPSPDEFQASQPHQDQA